MWKLSWTDNLICILILREFSWHFHGILMESSETFQQDYLQINEKLMENPAFFIVLLFFILPPYYDTVINYRNSLEYQDLVNLSWRKLTRFLLFFIAIGKRRMGMN